MWVDPTHRNEGLGAAGMAAVIAYGLALAPRVSLYVNDFNVAARRMYDRVGMTQVGTFATILFSSGPCPVEGVAVPISAVIFDWGGTLTPWHTIDADAAWATLTDDPDAVKALRAAEDELWTRSRDEHRSGTLDELLAAAGANPDADALARLHGWWDQHTLSRSRGRADARGACGSAGTAHRGPVQHDLVARAARGDLRPRRSGSA